jgi:phosphopantothenoylcysteine decarboxylase/phosphopantothenate--cysteine ligase
MLKGKNILIGISGGIAAYKTPYLVRLFKLAGADVKVILTDSASQFVSPLTLATLSENPVPSSFIKEDEQGDISWNNHVALALWADLMVVAPATANTLSKMAHGQSDNLLLVTYLSAKCPVFIAPAMDLDMYKHKSTKDSLDKLATFGDAIIPAEEGLLASGLSGAGRMAEPEHIVAFIVKHLKGLQPLSGKRVIVTAGPTYEPIDPVRFIGNHSSGLMGYELADYAAKLGAEVVLVSGPTSLLVSDKTIKKFAVATAIEMNKVVLAHFETSDIFIGAAAVADYRPAQVYDQKIKKESLANPNIELIKNPDIIAGLGKIKKHQYLVGFALETQDVLDNGTKKLYAKNLDAIVLNSLEDPGAGFGHKTNKVQFLSHKNGLKSFPLKSKKAVAIDLWNEILKEL